MAESGEWRDNGIVMLGDVNCLSLSREESEDESNKAEL